MARAVRTFSGKVLQEWGDYNNHLNEGYYGVIFGHASDGLLDLLGFGADYRENENGTFYTVEAHIRFEAEIAIVTTRVAADIGRGPGLGKEVEAADHHLQHHQRADERHREQQQVGQSGTEPISKARHWGLRMGASGRASKTRPGARRS